ncbi:MAG TPA: S41 family peptidase [Chitinophagaceae bacterium]
MKLRIITIAILSLAFTFANAQTISAKEKLEIIVNTKQALGKQYHFKQQVPAICTYIDGQWKEGAYSEISDRNEFTTALAADMKKAAKDNHLNYFYTAAEIAGDKKLEQQMPWHLVNDKFLNNGVTAMQILSGDVGYLKVQAMGYMDELLPAAFTYLQHTQALIIDIRGNGGGMLSNILASYLLPEDSIHLNTINWNDRTDSIFTKKTLAGPRYLNKPVYLLTDKGTFSSAEEFAYDLKAMQRVTIVGEATGGGANPGGLMNVYTFKDGTRLDMYVSMAQVVNPVTQSNWEGSGVQPDVKVKSEDALKKAHDMALEFLQIREHNAVIKKAYQDIRKRI